MKSIVGFFEYFDPVFTRLASGILKTVFIRDGWPHAEHCPFACASRVFPSWPSFRGLLYFR